MQHTDDVVHAGFWRRWIALLLDQLVLGVGFYAVAFVLILGAGFAGGFDWLRDVDPDAPPALLVVAYLALFFGYYVVAGLYFSLMESSRHQATLGKQVLGIKVVDGHGRRLSFGRALGRWAAATLSYVTLYIGFLMAAFTQRKRALHDMVAGTQVVDRWAYTGHPDRQRRELGGCLVALVAGVILMTLVAVLGILAAITIPAYQDYTLRAKVVQAISGAAPLRSQVASFSASEGRCPANEDIIAVPAYTPGTFAGRVTLEAFDDGSCGIELELAGTGRVELDFGRIWWQLEPGTGAWHCYSDIDDRWLPQECRS